MDAKQKQIQQEYIQGNLKGIAAVISKLVQDRDAFSAKMQDFNMHGRAQYTQEFFEQEAARMKSVFMSAMEAVNTDLQSRLDNLYKLIAARDETLDMSNLAFGTALNLIQAAGGEPSHEQARVIHESFKYDQQALKALQGVYHGKDIGGISKMIYDLDEVIGALKKLATDATIRDGSVNAFSSRLAKLAAIEGVELPANPDDRGTMEAMRRGASLIS